MSNEVVEGLASPTLRMSYCHSFIRNKVTFSLIPSESWDRWPLANSNGKSMLGGGCIGKVTSCSFKYTLHL